MNNKKIDFKKNHPIFNSRPISFPIHLSYTPLVSLTSLLFSHTSAYAINAYMHA